MTYLSAADWIAIHAQNDWAPPYEYSIYSIDGRRMRYIKSDSPIQTIDVGGYPRGTYVISVQSGDDRNVSKVVLR